MINLSRNTPIALVVGAAGFIGSSVADKLLEKGIQVVGVDNLSTGKKENLDTASRSKKFHFLNQDMGSLLPVDLPRLDYAYFIISETSDRDDYCGALDNFLKVCNNFLPKIVLTSSIDLYGEKGESAVLQMAERRIAEFTKEKNANARVVRLASVFGPRMHFRGTDPILKLIFAAATDALQKEPTPLDFTTRALYIADVADLLLKSTLHGATAQKIYDGARLVPVKVAEIKQVLLDPVWHEMKKFEPTELPPWNSPNLEKTVSELSWKPKAKLVEALKSTLHFLLNNPGYLEAQGGAGWPEQEEKADNEKNKEREQLIKEFRMGEREVKKNVDKINMEGPFKFMLTLVILALFTAAVIYPAGALAWNYISIGQYTKQGENASGEHNFANMLFLFEKADKAEAEVKGALASFKRLDVGGILPGNITSDLDVLSAKRSTARGEREIMEALQVISGGGKGDEISRHLERADAYFAKAEQKISNLGGDTFYIERVRKAVAFLPKIIPQSGEKIYLIVLFDENNLKIGGGEIKSLSEAKFKDGKLLEIKEDSMNLNKQVLSVMAEPDFPSSAKTILALFQSQTGRAADGVIAWDNVAAQDLNELFYLPGRNFLFALWGPNEAFAGKHTVAYMVDPEIESYLLSENFGGRMFLEPKEKDGMRRDFLSVLTEGVPLHKIGVEKIINTDGKVTTKLVLSSLGANFGKVRVYLEVGEQLINLNAKSLSDFGRVGYEFENVGAENLVLEFTSQKKADFTKGKLDYILDIAKQVGAGSTPLEFKLRYPAGYSAKSGGGEANIPQELSFTSDLAQDRDFDIILAQ